MANQPYTRMRPCLQCGNREYHTKECGYNIAQPDGQSPVLDSERVEPDVVRQPMRTIQVALMEARGALQQIKDGTEGNRGRCVDCEAVHITADDSLSRLEGMQEWIDEGIESPAYAVPPEPREAECHVVADAAQEEDDWQSMALGIHAAETAPDEGVKPVSTSGDQVEGKAAADATLTDSNRVKVEGLTAGETANAAQESVPEPETPAPDEIYLGRWISGTACDWIPLMRKVKDSDITYVRSDIANAEVERLRDRIKKLEHARQDDFGVLERIAASLGMKSFCCGAETMELESRARKVAAEIASLKAAGIDRAVEIVKAKRDEWKAAADRTAHAAGSARYSKAHMLKAATADEIIAALEKEKNG